MAGLSVVVVEALDMRARLEVSACCSCSRLSFALSQAAFDRWRMGAGRKARM